MNTSKLMMGFNWQVSKYLTRSFQIVKIQGTGSFEFGQRRLTQKVKKRTKRGNLGCAVLFANFNFS